MDAPLLEALTRWRSTKVLVVGDFMLDQIVHGEATRLAPDAPVPILHASRTEDRAGGAANVCAALRALRCEVRAVGLRGDDAEGARLDAALREAGVDAGALRIDRGRPTTLKRSLVGLAQGRHPQKMFRVDVEDRREPSAEAERLLIEAALSAMDGVDAVCVEDYAKGVCSPAVCRAVIEAARRSGVPVLVDPAARDDYARYRGATAITPNRSEAELATRLRTAEGADAAHNAALARTIAEMHDIGVVVLTLDRHGALLYESVSGRVESVPTRAREVYDVTGAGDVMFAALAAGHAAGLGWPDAVRLANAAAGLEVEVVGVQPIPLERVHHALLLDHLAARPGDRLRTREEVVAEARAVRAMGRRVVFTNGCFDILHAGHVSLLERSRALGDHLIVAINSDASVRRLKGAGRPVNGEADRAMLLGALRCVDAVTVFEEDTPIPLLELILPDVLVKGGDYAPDGVVGREVVERGGGRVELVGLVEGRSTTATIERLRGRAAAGV